MRIKGTGSAALNFHELLSLGMESVKFLKRESIYIFKILQKI